MALKFLSLKNEMEGALREITKIPAKAQLCETCKEIRLIKGTGEKIKVPDDARVGESATNIMKQYAEAYVKAVTKKAFQFARDLTKRTTLKGEEMKIAVETVTYADIEREIQREREAR